MSDRCSKQRASVARQRLLSGIAGPVQSPSTAPTAPSPTSSGTLSAPSRIRASADWRIFKPSRPESV